MANGSGTDSGGGLNTFISTTLAVRNSAIEGNVATNGAGIFNNGNPLLFDQRGFPRLGPCDIGPYEYVLRNFLPVIQRH
jgi:hypothetical protein